MARSIVVWQIDCRLRDRGWDPQRNKRAAPIVQRFGSLSVRRREDRLPGSQGTGKRSRDRLGYRGWLPPCSDTAPARILLAVTQVQQDSLQPSR
jgi:hypothetical protein